MPKSTPTRTTPRTTTQTVRIAGVRTRLVTKNGKLTATAALPLEWEYQAAQVRALKAMPEYGSQFLIAGDQNAARRGPKAQVQAKATGMEPGEFDLRVYMAGGVLGLIENKVGRASLSPAQKQRHADLERLGFTRQAVVRAVTTEDAAVQAVSLVRKWLAHNDNELDKVSTKRHSG